MFLLVQMLVVDFNSIKVQLELIWQGACGSPPLFQFHKGTIRTVYTYCRSFCFSNFNSIKVQLELTLRVVFVVLILVFQFHKGTIRTVLLAVRLLLHLDFNSIKVQLELPVVGRYGLTLVFQFHKGTIRTCVLLSICR